MKIDSVEMQALEQHGAARLDIYSAIHKAMRALMCDTLIALGQVDVDDEPELRATMDRVMLLAQLCQSHLEHEDSFVHPAMQARTPGACDQVHADHVEHRRHVQALIDAAQALPRAPAPQRPTAALALYRELALFVADNFQHMHREETQHNAALWSAYTDQELQALHGRIVASLPPQENLLVMRWMVPALTPAERTAVLADLREHAPAPAFEAVLDQVRPHLSVPAWAKLARSLQLPAVAGLVA